MVLGVILVFLSYLLGSVNSSIIVGHMFGIDDIRNHGSGNAGSTNVLRTIGKKAALITFLGDVLKGVLPPVIANIFCKDFAEVFMLLCAFAVVFGHVFPVFFGFRGGKGVATSLGAVSAVSIISGVFFVTPLLLLVWLLVVAVTRYVSLGSCIVMAAYIVIAMVMYTGRENYPAYVVFAVLTGGMGIIKHKNNIVRLLNKTENKIGEKAKDNKLIQEGYKGEE